MLLTNNKKIFNSKLLEVTVLSKIITRTDLKNQIWNYRQIELGFNFRMNELEASLGLSQFKRLGFFVKKKPLSYEL